jgi:hypothetical protein
MKNYKIGMILSIMESILQYAVIFLLFKNMKCMLGVVADTSNDASYMGGIGRRMMV